MARARLSLKKRNFKSSMLLMDRARDRRDELIESSELVFFPIAKPKDWRKFRVRLTPHLWSFLFPQNGRS